MCGISGRFNFDGLPVTEAEVVAMRDTMVHRGPDGAGIFLDGNVGLGHRRLSIIDLAGGAQPISNDDGTLNIVFNGEIYNYQELRADLLARGHKLKTHSDTEVIVHLYEAMGIECLERLRGMFAFALWDANRKRLFIARDRVGEKPLYYRNSGKSLLFGSEIKALLEATGERARIDATGLRRYLAYRHVYGTRTLFEGVNQLAPGHYLLADAAGVTVREYWNAPQPDAAARTSGAEFLPLLEASVHGRMISDVPIGVFLSGGIDSSVITALMARRTESVRSFSIGFVPGEENELYWAKRVAGHCKAEHHEFLQRAEDFFGMLQQLVWHHDEPLTFPASIPLYLLSRESKRVATVMLGGEGADELLAGYGSNIRAYHQQRLAGFVPRALRRVAATLARPTPARRVFARAAQSDTEFITGAFRLANHATLAAACRIPLPDGANDDQALLAEVGFGARGGSFLDRLLYFQFKTYLIALLMKQDKMSMAASIETRVPYLDHELVEYCFRLPENQKIRGQVGKRLLRDVSPQLLPQDVITRPKQGFPVPIAAWFRVPGNPFIATLLDETSTRDGLIEPRVVRDSVAAFQKGANNSLELWALLNLELWRRKFVG